MNFKLILMEYLEVLTESSGKLKSLLDPNRLLMKYLQVLVFKNVFFRQKRSLNEFFRKC